ncbi:aspartate aminotransferase, putative [Theileria equi strain WA]|uniref:Aspartate aminotransferase, putative n=1 Tax=Theileria equi strain WA TaxID=1537102 RepID=L0ATS0_THEEQ|nr:aspartate aminotransferase, putative [Theileria equi strain WA]AFZ78935.1 aspartate aminotransferase, putative [Theileria equi strain WA]|eukprot:XP_004828601.1 aspartate aminotransferase, putative [Theileria equi strain WA]
MSVFEHLEFKPPDLIFGPAELAKNDPHPDKVDLTVGVYKGIDGKPFLFNAVKRAKNAIVNDVNEFEEYLPLSGHEKFTNEARNLIFNEPCYNNEDFAKLCNRILSIHTASATNALFLGLLLIKKNIPYARKFYASNPCWVAYKTIATGLGLEYGEYTYFDYKTGVLDIDGLVQSLNSYNKGDIIMLQVSAHNPTGVDPNHEQWIQILEIIKKKELIPFLDCAYQGFASGELVEDAYPVRLFAEANIDVFVAQSFSKIMGIFSARLGVLHLVMKKEDDEMKKIINSNMVRLARSCYGSPTRHGAEIAYRIMSTPDLRSLWSEELDGLIKRIIAMRRKLYETLVDNKVPGSWEHIIKQRGMFAFLNISPEAIERLKDEHHVYIISNSRICVAVLNDHKINHFVKALYSVLT